MCVCVAGVSNFRVCDLQQILSFCRIPPAVNQIECHPQLQSRDLVQFCAQHSIVIASYSPLMPLTDPDVAGTEVKAACEAIAQHSPSQVLLRWNLEQSPDRAVVTTSRRLPRIEENLLIQSVSLSEEEIQKITTLGQRIPQARKFWTKEFELAVPLRA